MGKKKKVGGIVFDEQDRLFIFVTYCPSCHGKVLFTREEAQQFAKHYKCEQNKIRTKYVLKFVKQ